MDVRPLGEAAVGAGHDVLRADEPRGALEALGNELGVLDAAEGLGWTSVPPVPAASSLLASGVVVCVLFGLVPAIRTTGVEAS